MIPWAAPAAALLVVLVVCRVRAPRAAGRARQLSMLRSSPVCRHGRIRSRSRPPGAEQWAALLDTIAAEVRTGSSLAAAQLHAQTRHPSCVAADHPQHPDAALVQLTLHSARALGGPVAATLDSAAAIVRERLAVRADIAVHSAQARLSARVLTAVPLVFCAWNVLSSPSFRRAVYSPVGMLCVASGALCNLAGWAWMRWHIQRVVR